MDRLDDQLGGSSLGRLAEVRGGSPKSNLGGGRSQSSAEDSRGGTVRRETIRSRSAIELHCQLEWWRLKKFREGLLDDVGLAKNAAFEEGSSSLPMSGRLAGVDFGDRFVSALSTCDPSQTLGPRRSILTLAATTDWTRHSSPDFAKREAICGWVIGLPIHCDGKESQKSVEVRRFAEWLESVDRFAVRTVRRAIHDSRSAAHASRIRVCRRPKKKKTARSTSGTSHFEWFLWSRGELIRPQNDALDDGP